MKRMDYHFKITFFYQRHLHFPLVYGAAVTDSVSVDMCSRGSGFVAGSFVLLRYFHLVFTQIFVDHNFADVPGFILVLKLLF